MRRLPVLLSLSPGCSGPSRDSEPPPPKLIGPRLYPVRGAVTVEGKLLSRVVVALSDAGTHSVGETKADGTCELAHNGRPGGRARRLPGRHRRYRRAGWQGRGPRLPTVRGRVSR